MCPFGMEEKGHKRCKRVCCQRNGVTPVPHYVRGREIEFKVTSHGNSRNSANKPFYPTARSTLDAIKQKVKVDTAAHVYNDVKKEVGGPSRARTPGSLPCSLNQVSDIKVQARRSDDPVGELLVYARKKDEKTILRHQDMPADIRILKELT